MNKRFRSLLIVTTLMAAFAFFVGLRSHENYAPAGIYGLAGAQIAAADTLPGSGPTGGNATNIPPDDAFGRYNECSGTGTLAAGTLTKQLPCIAKFTQCGVTITTNGTPGVYAISCAPTQVATTTIIASATATFTVPAVAINAGTANATPGIAVWGGPK